MIDGESYSTYGFSGLAIIIGAIASGVMFLVWLVVSFKKYPTGIPFAATCSAVISAACHYERGSEIYVERLRWAVVDDNDGVGHCAFSDKEVGVLIEDKLYA